MTGRWTTTAGLLCLIVAATGGCVSKSKYNKVLSAARQANAQLEDCKSAAGAARVENQKLRDELALRDEMVAAKDKKIQALEDVNTEQQKTVDALYAKLKEHLEKDRTPLTPLVLPAGISAGLKALAEENADLMEYLPNYGMLKLKADPTFDKGSAVVKPGAAKALKKLAEIVNSEEAKRFNIYVAGHTDDIPLKKESTIRLHGSNWGLSAHRALAVIKELWAAGVEQQRMGGMGFSKYHPVAANAPGRKGNPRNRRVEIWIVPPNRFLTVGAK